MKHCKDTSVRLELTFAVGLITSLSVFSSAAQIQSQSSSLGSVAYMDSGQEKNAGTGTAQKREVDLDKRVCKRMEVTGSRFVKTVCHTNAEWEDMAEGTRSKMREIDSMPVKDNGQINGSGETVGP